MIVKRIFRFKKNPNPIAESIKAPTRRSALVDRHPVKAIIHRPWSLIRNPFGSDRIEGTALAESRVAGKIGLWSIIQPLVVS
jgi:hypothetical protein